MVTSKKKVIIKDVTLREGLDTPNVEFTLQQKMKIIKNLVKANVPEIEVIAPTRIFADTNLLEHIKTKNLQTVTSGLIYSYSLQSKEEIKEASKNLDRFDILMPLSEKRKPFNRDAKISLISDILLYALSCHPDVGVGFPHSMQVEGDFLLEIGKESIRNGARRLTVYDTNGSKDPFEIYNLIKRLKRELKIPLFFHGHNDLGLATANSLAAVYAGADGLDLTVNGLGDRAGNASLEQVVLLLYLKGFDSTIKLDYLPILSSLVEKESRIKLSKIAPVVGEYIFCHKSPSHLEVPELFEAFPPRLLGFSRELGES
jgi:isopropylmalate/homocitrate/citramalate synthase